jgi:hypothetical protein
MSSFRINDDTIWDSASGDDDLSVRAVGIHREDPTLAGIEKK